MPTLYKTLVAGMIGNVMEWYDFALFGYFAPVIARLFFPSDNHLVSLINTFGVFAAGFLMRPVGAAIFGHIGDTAGRKRSLTLSVMLMAIPTFLMGLLPTYAQIGVLAPIALTLLRMLQGISVGGEYTGSMTLLIESASPARRGFIGSWVPFSTCIGILLGSGIGALLTADMAPEALYSWGWRLPFLLGIVVGVCGLYLRRGLSESKDFQGIQEAGEVAASPVQEVMADHRSEIITAICLNWLNGAAFYTVFVYLITYLASILKFPLGSALIINTISMAFLAVLLPVVGALSDRVGRKPIMVVGAASMVLFAYPLFQLLSHHTFEYVLFGQLAFAFLIAVYFGPLPATVVDLFPPRRRCSGLSISYNFALAVFGGTAPLIATFLIKETGNPLSPSFYLIISALVSLLFAWRIPAMADVAPFTSTTSQSRSTVDRTY
ncbi:MFS transporter [Nitrospira sp. KM1]|uniref:MFS transporter n=1 Tax=Nitrospira sp. KM1 TaxID=1936990 RepID=UPI0013A71E72|nr:MFS transporter [Nitrospira sp. KM1]BCA53822.1 MFS transporter [Nitrospira sp. KM1]